MNTKFRSIGALLSAGTTLAIVAGLGVGVANADPVPTGNRQLAVVGSETLTPVVNSAANDATALAIGGVRKVASFNATGSATIDTHGGTLPACTAITRPNGSGAGRTALLASLNAGDNCIQGSRSSDDDSATAAAPNLVYIPFGREPITYAITNVSNFPKNLSTADLKGYFKCTKPNLFGSSPYTSPNYRSMLPQNGSGTRKYWIKTMDYVGSGITVPNSGAVPGAACVQNGADEGGALIEEHNGTQVNNSEIVPFSVAQWTSQAAGVIGTDVRGATRLGQVDLLSPFQDDFGLQRDLYMVFPEADVIAVSPPAGSNAQVIQALFKGPTSQMCTGAGLSNSKRFGLFPIANCGDTSKVTP